jgi:hypothetical protein
VKPCHTTAASRSSQSPSLMLWVTPSPASGPQR